LKFFCTFNIKKIKELLLSNIDILERKNIYKLYFLYIFFIITFTIIYSFFFINNFQSYLDKDNFNIVIEKLPFGLGSLLHNLVYNNTFISKLDGIDFYLGRHPFLPIFFATLLKISKNFFFFIITKNIIIFSTYFILSYIFLLKNKNTILLFLAILLAPVIIPYNFSVALNFVYEDNLLTLFLPLLFLNLLTRNKYKFLFLGIILFILYFIKGSVFFIVLFLPLVIIFYNYNKKFNYFPLIASFIAIIIWGSFGYYKTGRFPSLGSQETIYSKDLTMVYNKYFHLYYPHITVDLLAEKTNNTLKTEWQYYDYYNTQNKNYLRNNFYQFLSDILLKIKFIFFGIRVDGLFTENNVHPSLISEKSEEIIKYSSAGIKINKNGDLPYKNPIRISSIFSKFFFNLAIIIATIKLYKNYKIFFKNKLEIYFLSILILYLPPFIVGWATSKHLIPISNITLVYLILYFNNKIVFKMNIK
jgi:hypothetical protein